MTNLQIPSFCVTEITDQARFSNDGLASRPFSQWAADFDAELHRDGPPDSKPSSAVTAWDYKA